jgi:PBP1b-binding outer membrane lipoprotein LpoB
MFRSLAVVVSLVFFAGCAHSNANKAAAEPKAANPAEVEKVKKRAEIDLNCQAVTVEVLEQGSMMQPWTFAAKGCDKSATYLARMGTIIRN